MKINCYSWQKRVEFPTHDENAIAKEAFNIFTSKYVWRNPIRSLTISAISLEHEGTTTQLGIFYDNVAHEKRERRNQTIDNIRDIYGKHDV